jgi:hypothetical protein
LIRRYLQNGKVIKTILVYKLILIRYCTAWLRGRRAQAPEPDEVLKSLAISQMKKENAKKVAMNNPFVIVDKPIETKPQFPVYEDYDLPHKKES